MGRQYSAHEIVNQHHFFEINLIIGTIKPLHISFVSFAMRSRVEHQRFEAYTSTSSCNRLCENGNVKSTH